MKKTLTILLLAFALCSCESSCVKQGREAYKYRLSCLYYEYVVDEEFVSQQSDGSVQYTVITRIRKKDGEPYKPKSFKFVCKDGKVISQE